MKTTTSVNRSESGAPAAIPNPASGALNSPELECPVPTPQSSASVLRAGGISGARKVIGRLLVRMGTALSPALPLDCLSNVPLALLGASVVAPFHPAAFQPVFAITYFLSHAVSLPLVSLGMHLLGRPAPKANMGGRVRAGFVLGLGYTLVITYLDQWGVFRAVLAGGKSLAAAFGLSGGL